MRKNIKVLIKKLAPAMHIMAILAMMNILFACGGASGPSGSSGSSDSGSVVHTDPSSTQDSTFTVEQGDRSAGTGSFRTVLHLPTASRQAARQLSTSDWNSIVVACVDKIGSIKFEFSGPTHLTSSFDLSSLPAGVTEVVLVQNGLPIGTYTINGTAYHYESWATLFEGTATNVVVSQGVATNANLTMRLFPEYNTEFFVSGLDRTKFGNSTYTVGLKMVYGDQQIKSYNVTGTFTGNDFYFPVSLPYDVDHIEITVTDDNGDFHTYGADVWIIDIINGSVELLYQGAGLGSINLNVTFLPVDTTPTGNLPPTGLNFTWSPSTATVANTITFTGTATDPNGDPLTYGWSFQDVGGNGGYTGNNAPYLWSNSGTYAVTMTVTDGRGGSTSLTKNVVVTSGASYLAPVSDANFTGPATVARNVPIQFIGDTSFAREPGATIVAYLWSFGDGTTSTLANPVHYYSTAGTYYPTLMVTDGNGMTDINTSLVITVTGN